MDINMPGKSGFKCVKEIKEAFPNIKIVMYTIVDDDQHIFDAICAGADGYLLKKTSPNTLIKSLNELLLGGAPMSPYVAKQVINFFKNDSALLGRESFNLTNRETVILGLLVKGHSYKMIAFDLKISIDTVKKHLQNIYHKLHVNCGTEAVAKAIKNRIVDI